MKKESLRKFFLPIFSLLIFFSLLEDVFAMTEENEKDKAIPISTSPASLEEEDKQKTTSLGTLAVLPDNIILYNLISPLIPHHASSIIHVSKAFQMFAYNSSYWRTLCQEIGIDLVKDTSAFHLYSTIEGISFSKIEEGKNKELKKQMEYRKAFMKFYDFFQKTPKEIAFQIIRDTDETVGENPNNPFFSKKEMKDLAEYYRAKSIIEQTDNYEKDFWDFISAEKVLKECTLNPFLPQKMRDRATLHLARRIGLRLCYDKDEDKKTLITHDKALKILENAKKNSKLSQEEEEFIDFVRAKMIVERYLEVDELVNEAVPILTNKHYLNPSSIRINKHKDFLLGIVRYHKEGLRDILSDEDAFHIFTFVANGDAVKFQRKNNGKNGEFLRTEEDGGFDDDEELNAQYHMAMLGASKRVSNKLISDQETFKILTEMRKKFLFFPILIKRKNHVNSLWAWMVIEDRIPVEGLTDKEVRDCLNEALRIQNCEKCEQKKSQASSFMTRMFHERPALLP